MGLNKNIKPKDLINYAKMNIFLGLDRRRITPSDTPNIHKPKLDSLKKHIQAWMDEQE